MLRLDDAKAEPSGLMQNLEAFRPTSQGSMRPRFNDPTSASIKEVDLSKNMRQNFGLYSVRGLEVKVPRGKIWVGLDELKRSIYKDAESPMLLKEEFRQSQRTRKPKVLSLWRSQRTRLNLPAIVEAP